MDYFFVGLSQLTDFLSVRAALASHTPLCQLGASRTGFYPSLNLRSTFAQPSLNLRSTFAYPSLEVRFK